MDIQKELNKNESILYIPNGLYLLENPLIIPPNNTIKMDTKAILKRANKIPVMLTNQISNNYRYAASGNINIIGGTVDMSGDTIKSKVQGIAFGHMENSIIKTKLVNGYDNHMIELNACKGIILIDCIFDSMHANKSRQFTEMVQIDLAKKGTYHLGYFDNTPCEKITIDNCTFINSGRAIGSHSYVNVVYHKDINIINNKFFDMRIQAIRGMLWDNATINNNRFDNCVTAIKFNGCKNAYLNNNYGVNIPRAIAVFYQEGIKSKNINYRDNNFDKSFNRHYNINNKLILKDYYNSSGPIYKSRKYTDLGKPVYTKYYKNKELSKVHYYDVLVSEEYKRLYSLYYNSGEFDKQIIY